MSKGAGQAGGLGALVAQPQGVRGHPAGDSGLHARSFIHSSFDRYSALSRPSWQWEVVWRPQGDHGLRAGTVARGLGGERWSEPRSQQVAIGPSLCGPCRLSDFLRPHHVPTVHLSEPQPPIESGGDSSLSCAVTWPQTVPTRPAGPAGPAVDSAGLSSPCQGG